MEWGSRAGHGYPAGQPRVLRQINQRSVVEAIRRHGALTRAEIARLIGVSKPTVADVCAELTDSGLLRQAGEARGTKGPRAALYELDHRAAWVLGVDIGRRWLRVALADLSGTIVRRADERVGSRRGRTIVEELDRLARRLVADADADWVDVAHVTVGGPGAIDRRDGRLLLAPNLPAWDRHDLLSAIRSELGTAVSFENDVNLAALGELWQGHGRDFEHFVFLWIGTGVGAGLVLDGELFRGGHGLAGEVGYVPVDGPAVASTTGARRRGAFEEAVAADALVAIGRQHGLDEPVTPERILRAATAGDGQARQVVDELARRLAYGLAGIAAVLDPEAVILGGGIGDNAGVMLRPLEEHLARLSPMTPRLLTSALGADAVLHGAVGTALSSAWDHVIERVAVSSRT